MKILNTKVLLFMLSTLFCVSNIKTAQAQFEFLGDLEPSQSGGEISVMANVGETIYFLGEGPGKVRGIWKSDGTTAGTQYINLDYLNPKPSIPISYSDKLICFNGKAIFSSSIGIIATDGTNAGTRIISSEVTSVRHFTAMDNYVFFLGVTAGYGDEPWRTDGTEEGTYMIKDINVSFKEIAGSSTGSFSSNPLVFGDKIIFSAKKPNQAKPSLFISDGTEEGSIIIKEDIEVYSSTAAEMNGVLYFSGRNATYGTELWRTDGTENGTYLVKDISPGSGHSSPRNFFTLGNTVFFNVVYGDVSTRLWRTDGTENGTKTNLTPPLDNILLAENDKCYTMYNNGLYYLSEAYGSRAKMLSLDGLSIPNYSYAMGVLNGDIIVASKAYQPNLGPTEGYELYSFHPSTTIQQIEDINPGDGNGVVMNGTAGPKAGISTDNHFYFYGNDGLVSGLYKLSHSPYAIELVYATSNIGTAYVHLTSVGEYNNKFVFNAPGNGGIFTSDGTKEGTQKLINENGSGFVEKDGKLYFAKGAALWVTDGTQNGTDDLWSGGEPHYIEATNKVVFMSSSTINLPGSVGTEPWVTDGTLSGTKLLKDLNPGTNSVGYLHTTKNHVYMTAIDYDYLYATDGTAAGSLKIDDWTCLNNYNNLPGEINGSLVFYGNKGYQTKGLAFSDGTVTGTRYIVEDLSDCNTFKSFNNLVYFNTPNGTYVTDGTANGTIRIFRDPIITTTTTFSELGDSTIIRTNARGNIKNATIDYVTRNTELDVTETIVPVRYSFERNNINYGIRIVNNTLHVERLLGTDLNNPIVAKLEGVSYISQIEQWNDYIFICAVTERYGSEWYSFKVPAQPNVKMDVLNNGEEVFNNAVIEPIANLSMGKVFEKQIFTIVNGGSQPLQLSNPNFSGDYASYFEAIDFPSEIAPNESADITVRYYGNKYSGLQESRFSFTTNDPERPNFSVTVSGQSSSYTYLNILELSTIKEEQFIGTTVLGNTLTKELTLYNWGTAGFKIDSIVFSGIDKDAFSANFSKQKVEPLHRFDVYPDDKLDSLYNNPHFSTKVYVNMQATLAGENRASITFYYTGNKQATYTIKGRVDCGPSDSIRVSSGDAIMCSKSFTWPTLSTPVVEDASYCWSRQGSITPVGPTPYGNYTIKEFTFDPENKPVIAYLFSDGTKVNLRVARLENNVWTNVGDDFSPSYYFTSIFNLVYNNAGQPFLGFNNSSNKYQVYTLNANVWEKIGEDVSSAAAYQGNLAILNNQPHVFYREEATGERNKFPILRKWNGDTWEDVVFTDQLNHAIAYPIMKAQNNKLYMAFMDGGVLGSGVSVYTYDGITLERLGKRAFSDYSTNLELDVDINGIPYILNQVKGISHIFYFDNNQWIEIENPNSSFNAKGLSVNNGQVAAGVTNYISTYTDSTWTTINLLPSTTASSLKEIEVKHDKQGELFVNTRGDDYFYTLLKAQTTQECLGTGADFTPSEFGNYSVWVNKNGCNVKSLNSILVGGKACAPVFKLYNKENHAEVSNQYPPSTYYGNHFGYVTLNSSKTNEFIIANEGTGPLTLTNDVRIEGTDAALFSINGQPQRIIPAGGTDTLRITYSPTAYGDANANFVIPVDNNGYESLREINIKGTCTGYTAVLEDELIIDVNQNGLYDLGEDRVQFTFTVTRAADENTQRTLDFTLLNVQPYKGLYYTTILDSESVTNGEIIMASNKVRAIFRDLTPGQSGVTTFSVEPSYLTTKWEGQMQSSYLNSDDPTVEGFEDANSVEYAPKIGFKVSGNSQIIEPNSSVPSPINYTDFGEVNLGYSLKRAFYLSYDGNRLFTINDVYLTGEGKDDYSVYYNEETRAIMLRYMANSFTPSNATVNIASNHDEYPNYSFAVTGKGKCYEGTKEDFIVSCESITWIDGKEYSESNNTAVHTYIDGKGCEVRTLLDYVRLDTETCVNYGSCLFDLSLIQTSNVLNTMVQGATYQWYWVDHNNNYHVIADGTENSFTVWHSGSYAVEITKDGCTEMSQTYNMVVTNSQHDKVNKVHMYPNPTKGQVTIELPDTEENAILSVINLSGRLIDQVQISNTNKIQYQLKGEPGMYLLQIRSKSYKSVMRIIKE